MSDSPAFEAVRYRHSGKVGRAPFVFLLLTMILYAIPSYLYGLLSIHIGYMKLKIVILVILGMGLGYATVWLARRRRCRSTFFTVLAAALGSAVGTYVGVAVFMETVMALGGTKAAPFTFGALVADPDHWWNTLNLIDKLGIFTRRGRTLSGWSLWIDWGFELGSFWFSALGVAWATILSKPFCEECELWLDIEKSALLFDPPTDGAVRERLVRGDLSALQETAKLEPVQTGMAHIRLDYVLCKQCGNMGTYRIMAVDPENKKEPEAKLSKLMLFTPQAVQILGGLMAQVKADAPSESGASEPPPAEGAA